MIAGFVLAFLAAFVATFLDCYNTMAKSLARVPGVILAHPMILGLSALCGCLAAGAFYVTDPAGGDVVSTAITLKQTNPILRGLAVGAMVLVLIRSKVFNLQDSGLGGDFLYTLARSLALQAVNDRRTQERTTFLNANIDAAFAIPTYFSQLEVMIKQAMKVRSPELQQRADDEIKAVKSNESKSPMDKAVIGWSAYYHSMTGICFDNCGPSILRAFPGFVKI